MVSPWGSPKLFDECLANHKVVQKKDSADELWDVLEVNAEFAS